MYIMQIHVKFFADLFEAVVDLFEEITTLICLISCYHGDFFSGFGRKIFVGRKCLRGSSLLQLSKPLVPDDGFAPPPPAESAPPNNSIPFW